MKYKCILCNKEFEGFGNNPWPISSEGYCCDECNASKVIPVRIGMVSLKEVKKPKTTLGIKVVK